MENVLPVHSNIIIFHHSPNFPQHDLLGMLSEKDILAIGFGPQTIRMVTHLDIHDPDIEKVESVLKQL